MSELGLPGRSGTETAGSPVRYPKAFANGGLTVIVRNRAHHQVAYCLVHFSRHKEGMWLFGEAASLAQVEWRRACLPPPEEGTLFNAGDTFDDEEEQRARALVARIRKNLEHLQQQLGAFTIDDHQGDVLAGVLGQARQTHQSRGETTPQRRQDQLQRSRRRAQTARHPAPTTAPTMTASPRDVQRLTDHLRSSLGDGPFHAPGGWTHMGAVICDASFQARRNYETTIRPRVLALQKAWPDARTVQGFQARLATYDLATAMNFHDLRRVTLAHRVTDLLAAHHVDTRDDLNAWQDRCPYHPPDGQQGVIPAAGRGRDRRHRGPCR
ncbi:hypothetical protein AB0H30_23105 [Streptomyces pseudogriseolus]|uniref:hypothetical protein n=1 Tax=Streptomyces pseudogriseolus TaxID=36817 RepID=UPI00347D9BA6